MCWTPPGSSLTAGRGGKVAGMTVLPPTPPPPLPTDDEMLCGVTRAAVQAGYDYVRLGRVRDLTRSGDGLEIRATVEGTARKPYAQRITLRPGKTTSTPFSGICTCPVEFNCKHVAAVLIAARGARPDPGTPTPAPPADPELPHAVTDWLDRLGAADAADPEAFPPSLKQRLLYVLGTARRTGGALALGISAVQVNVKKDGSLGAVRPFPAHHVHSAGYLRPSDRLILPRVAALRYTSLDLGESADLAELVRRILGTGRARWLDPHGAALTEGPSRPGRVVWTLAPDGSQRPALELDDPGMVALALPQPWYADPRYALMGEIDLGLPSHLAGRLLLAPPIPAAAVTEVRAARQCLHKA